MGWAPRLFARGELDGGVQRGTIVGSAPSDGCLSTVIDFDSSDLSRGNPDKDDELDSLPLPMLAVGDVVDLGAGAIIDLRSPKEFADDRLPGAINRPLFDNEERALVGFHYHRESPESAFAQGLQLLRDRLTELVAGILEAAGITGVDLSRVPAELDRLTSSGQHGLEELLAPYDAKLEGRVPLVVHCWRGGLRSQSVLALLRRLGVDAYGVDGGYKHYRRWVLEELEVGRPPRTVVLSGLTGVGKTLVLRELERQRPGWTLDLEGIAQHRSSTLGMVGLHPVSQKRFDGGCLQRLRAGFPQAWMAVEGESRKVGDAIIPKSLWQAMQSGVFLELTASLDVRVRVLRDDYLSRPESRVELAERLPFIEKRLGARKFDGVLTGMLEADRIDELVELLLERYYDPLYRHSEIDRVYHASFDTADPGVAAAEIAAWIESADLEAAAIEPTNAR